MKRLILLLCVLFCLGLVGCRGNSQAEVPQPIALPKATATLTADGQTIRADYQLDASSDGVIRLCMPKALITISDMTCEPQIVATDEQDGVLTLTLGSGGDYRLSLSFVLQLPKDGAAYYAREFYYLPDYLPRLACPTDYEVTWRLPSTYALVHGGEKSYRHYADGIQTRTYILRAATRLLMTAGTGLIGKEWTEGELAYYYVQDTRAAATAVTFGQAYARMQATWGAPGSPVTALLTGAPLGAYDGVVSLPAEIPQGDVAPVEAAARCWWDTLPVDEYTAPWIARSLVQYGVWYYYMGIKPLIAYKLYTAAHQAAAGYAYAHGQTRMDLPLSNYDQEAQEAVLECRGLLLWYALYQVVGERLNQALAALPRDRALDTDGVIDAICRALGDRYHDYFDAWLAGEVLLI